MNSSLPSSSGASSSSMPAQASTSSYPNAPTSALQEPSSRAPSSTPMAHKRAPSFMQRSSLSQGENRTASTSMAVSSSLLQPALKAGSEDDRHRKVVGISVQESSMANEDFFRDKFLSGDIVERVAGLDGDFFTLFFPTGKHGLLEELHNFHESGVTILTIQVKRGEHKISRRALVVPVKKKKYMFRDFEDPSHVFSFDDYTSEECDTLQGQARRLAQEQLSKIRVAAVDVAYSGEQKLQSADGFSMVYSMLVVPRAHADVEGAVLQAMTWLHGSKASGVPLILRNMQTEPIITEDVEQCSNAELANIVSSGAYRLQQLQGFSDHRAVIRAVRIWFAFHVAEVKVELEARQGEGLLGVTIGRTIEGFCYVAEVVRESAADRARLQELLDAAQVLGMKLVVTKVGNERVLPWFMSNGNIRCYDINSISSKLSAHRRAGQPACLHVVDIRDIASPRGSQPLGPSMASPSGVENNTATSMEL